MKNFKNRQSIGIIGYFILMLCFSCKKIDKEIDRQNAESGIVAFNQETALLGDTVLAYIKTGQKNASASLKIGDAEVRVLEKTVGVLKSRKIEIWKIIIPKNAPFGEPPVELTVNGQRKPAFFGLVLIEPPALIEGKVTATLFAGTFREKEYSDCGYEVVYAAKDGPQLQAQFAETQFVAYSKIGNSLYVLESYRPFNCYGEPDLSNTKNMIRKIQNGVVTTIAGGGSDPNGHGLSAKLPNEIRGFAVSPSGQLYLSATEMDYENSRVRSGILSIDPSSGKITAVADWQFYKGERYSLIKDGPALEAKLFEPQDMSFDTEGNLFFIDQSNTCIRKLDTRGMLSTEFGPVLAVKINDETYFTTDYSKRGHEDGFGNTEAQFGLLTGIAAAGNGKIYAVDNGGGRFGGCIREINPKTGEVATIIGLPKGVTGKETGSFKEVGAYYGDFSGLDTDFDGNLLLTTNRGTRSIKLFKVDLQFENVKLIGGGGYETDLTKPVPGNKAQLFGINIAFDDKGSLYIGDSYHYLIRKIERDK